MGINAIVIVEAFLAFIVAVTIHEAAHAGTAALLGDSGPVASGRLSLSPRRQMATIGTIVAVVFAFGSGGVTSGGLGWGRPVDVDARRLRVGPNFGLILVALAGPAVNALVGVGILFGLHAIPGFGSLYTAYPRCGAFGGQLLQQCLASTQSAPVLRVEQFLFAVAIANLALALVNLIPLHPLDGYKVVFALLPTNPALRWRSYEPYMELMLLVIFFVIPVILSMARIPLTPPGLFFIEAASNIAGSIAGPLSSLFLAL